ncbi:venom serine protease Bi-VSP-like [Ceratina calcarata]|uniref:CLIP domain-containing serine protease n=1 Tax=Ceratina calcarata TaxID=156304 RepID=A0AAJ7WBW7_9HYME|nr:venom serine protease Bi-VSP-like [Ceratina calcarata]
MTPTQVAGTCIDIKDCQPLLELLRREGKKGIDITRKFICHVEGKDQTVCCPGKPGMTMRQNLYGPLLPPQCGFSNVSHLKIIGGVPAKLNAWPWMAALGFRKTPTSEIKWMCGGSLISARHVLTAAHCAVRSDLFVIRLGELNLVRDDDGAHPIDVGIDKKIIHPKFEETYGHDIAIIRLDREIQFTFNADVKTSDVLMEVQVPVITTEACAKAYRASTIKNYKSLICTGGTGGKDSCKGDSGGPLMLPINGSYYELGVVMGGFLCAVVGYPGLSTRVTTYLQFIISNLQ